jgi:hypothetical protein
VTNLDDALLRLRAEGDANTCRKDFTPSEAVAIGERLEQLEREAAKERQKATRAKKGQKVGQNTAVKGAEKFSAPSGRSGRGRAADKVAQAVGMSRPTYKKAKALKAAADQAPEMFGDLQREMDETGKVDSAYRELRKRRSRAAAAPAATLPAEGAVPAALQVRPTAPDERWRKRWPRLHDYGFDLERVASDLRRLARCKKDKRDPAHVRAQIQRARKILDEMEADVLAANDNAPPAPLAGPAEGPTTPAAGPEQPPEQAAAV